MPSLNNEQIPFSEDYSLKKSVDNLNKILKTQNLSLDTARQILSTKTTSSAEKNEYLQNAMSNLRTKYWYNFNAKELKHMECQNNTELEKKYKKLAQLPLFQMSKEHAKYSNSFMEEANRQQQRVITTVPKAYRWFENPFKYHYKFDRMARFMNGPFRKIVRPIIKTIPSLSTRNSVVANHNKENAFIFSSGDFKNKAAPAFKLKLSPKEKSIQAVLSAAPVVHMLQHRKPSHKNLSQTDAIKIVDSNFSDKMMLDLIIRMNNVHQKPLGEHCPLELYMMEKIGFNAQEQMSLKDFNGCINAMHKKSKREKPDKNKDKSKLFKYIKQNTKTTVETENTKKNLERIFVAIQTQQEIPKKDREIALAIKQYVKKLEKKIQIKYNIITPEDFQEFALYKQKAIYFASKELNVSKKMVEDAWNNMISGKKVKIPKKVAENAWHDMAKGKKINDKQIEYVQEYMQRYTLETKEMIQEMRGMKKISPEKIAQMSKGDKLKLPYIQEAIRQIDTMDKIAPLYKWIAELEEEAKNINACRVLKAKNQELIDLIKNKPQDNSILKDAMCSWKNNKQTDHSTDDFILLTEQAWCAMAEHKTTKHMDDEIIQALQNLIEKYTGKTQLPIARKSQNNNKYNNLYLKSIEKDKKIASTNKPSTATKMLLKWDNLTQKRKPYRDLSLSSKYSNNHPYEQWGRMLHEAGIKHKTIFQINFWDTDFLKVLNSTYPIIFFDENRNTVVYIYPKNNNQTMEINTKKNISISTQVSQKLQDEENFLEGQEIGIKNFIIKEVKMSPDGTEQFTKSERDLIFAFYVQYPDYHKHDFKPERMQPLLKWANNIVIPEIDKQGHEKVLVVSNCQAGVNRSQCALNILDTAYRQKLMFQELRKNRKLGNIDDLTLAKVFNNNCQKNAANDLLAVITQTTSQGNGTQYSQYNNTVNAITMNTQNNIIEMAKSNPKNIKALLKKPTQNAWMKISEKDITMAKIPSANHQIRHK